MKKFGFTMAELLVTLGVIAVVAAITAPALENLFPDQNKVKVLKVYKTLSDINEEILNDPSLYMQESIYPDPNNSNKYITCPNPSDEELNCFRCSGMNCLQMPLDGISTKPLFNSSNYNAISKYSYILFYKLDATSDTPTEDSDNFYNWTKFRTKDNIEWAIGAPISNINNISSGYYSYIKIDVNPESTSNNCVYIRTTCPKPEQFSFLINNDGKVYGIDYLTMAYLQNPTKLNDKKHDYECAKNNATNCDQQ